VYGTRVGHIRQGSKHQHHIRRILSINRQYGRRAKHFWIPLTGDLREQHGKSCGHLLPGLQVTVSVPIATLADNTARTAYDHVRTILSVFYPFLCRLCWLSTQDRDGIEASVNAQRRGRGRYRQRVEEVWC
jgi:hypothetical protein